MTDIMRLRPDPATSVSATPAPPPRRGAGERGASFVEYAFLVGLIAMVCVASVQLFGGDVDQSFSRSGSTLTAN